MLALTWNKTKCGPLISLSIFDLGTAETTHSMVTPARGLPTEQCSICHERRYLRKCQLGIVYSYEIFMGMVLNQPRHYFPLLRKLVTMER